MPWDISGFKTLSFAASMKRVGMSIVVFVRLDLVSISLDESIAQTALTSTHPPNSPCAFDTSSLPAIRHVRPSNPTAGLTWTMQAITRIFLDIIVHFLFRGVSLREMDNSPETTRHKYVHGLTSMESCQLLANCRTERLYWEKT